jgi:ATP-binding cassette, subfamily B, bacterial
MRLRTSLHRAKNKDDQQVAGFVVVLRFAVCLAWRADRTRLLVTTGVQIATAAGLGIAVLALRSTLEHAIPSPQHDGLAGASLSAVLPGIATLAVLATVNGIAQIVRSSQLQVLTIKVEREAIGQVLQVTARAEPYRFDAPDFHDRVERAMSAARTKPVVLLYTALSMLQVMGSLLVVAGVFTTMAWWLAPLLVVAAAPALRTAKQVRQARYDLHRELSENRRAREYLQCLLTGRREAHEVHANGLGPLLLARWRARYATDVDRQSELTRVFMWRQLAARALSDVTVLAALGGLALAAYLGWLSLPTTLTALAGLWMLSTQVRNASATVANTAEAVLYLDDLRRLNAHDNQPGPVPVPVPALHTLATRDLWFSYPGSTEPALRGVTMDLHAGQVIALVGHNGSGKTTLAKIMAGLYPHDHGELLLNGQPPEDRSHLRELSAIVFQDFLRYQLPVIDNIAFGQPSAPVDRDTVHQAAQLAGIDTVLRGLDHGYNTVLGKEFVDGTELSVGQWQHLALARAFYRNAPLVVLDEPTAALDPHAEDRLLSHVRQLFAGRTVLLISHRLRGVRDADRIYVLDQGAITEHGTHDELITHNGQYATLFHTQAAAYLRSSAASGAEDDPGR